MSDGASSQLWRGSLQLMEGLDRQVKDFDPRPGKLSRIALPPWWESSTLTRNQPEAMVKN